MRARLYGIGIAVVMSAGIMGWLSADLDVNYVPVDGVILSTSVLCHLRKGMENVSDKVTHKAIEVPCNIAELAVQPGQARAGYDVVAETTIIYSYVSPVDKAPHTGATSRRGMVDLGTRAGVHIRIYAHKKDADTSKYVT